MTLLFSVAPANFLGLIGTDWLCIVVVAIAVASLPITSGCWESSWWGKPLYHYDNVSGGK